MPPPRRGGGGGGGAGHIVLPLSVPTYENTSHYLGLFFLQQLLLQFLMQGFVTCTTVQICIGHVNKENRISILVTAAELCPLEWYILDHITM